MSAPDDLLVVAIDGPAGAGKSSVARRLAAELGFAHLDTGAMYRAATLVALERGVRLNDATALAALVRGLSLEVRSGGQVRVNGRDVSAQIRTEAINAGVSTVASVPAVRAEMVRHQRAFAARERKVVAEGRDMCTVVFPDARLKVYLDADPQERARRRVLEQGLPATAEAVKAVRGRLESRDATDSGRRVSPLAQAPDAWYLDTTGLTLEEVVDRVRVRVRSSFPPAVGR